MALRPQVIDLVGADLVEEVGELTGIGEIAIVQDEAGLRIMRILVEMLDPLRMEGAGPPDQPVDRVALREQQLTKVRAVLP
jgi:hypothetical protein